MTILIITVICLLIFILLAVYPLCLALEINCPPRQTPCLEIRWLPLAAASWQIRLFATPLNWPNLRPPATLRLPGWRASATLCQRLLPGLRLRNFDLQAQLGGAPALAALQGGWLLAALPALLAPLSWARRSPGRPRLQIQLNPASPGVNTGHLRICASLPLARLLWALLCIFCPQPAHPKSKNGR